MPGRWITRLSSNDERATKHAELMSFTVDTTGFTRMAQSLSKMSGRDFAPVVRAETGKILEGCVRRTKVASSSSIRTSVAYRNRTLWEKGQWPPSHRGDPIISETKAGRIWFIEEAHGLSKST